MEAHAVQSLTTRAPAPQAFDTMRAPIFADVQTMFVDADSVLNSDLFISSLKERGVELVTAFPGHQQANFVERSIQHVKQVLRTTLDGLTIAKLWPAVLPDIVRYMNAMFLSSKGASPYEILTGWSPRGLLPFAASAEATLGHVFASRQALWETVSANLAKAAATQAKSYDLHRSDTRYVTGDVVLIRARRSEAEDGNFNLSPPFEPNPWIVEAVLSEVSLYLRATEAPNLFRSVHVSDVRHSSTLDADLRDSASPAKGEYVIQKIHAHRSLKDGNHFLIEWAGFRNKKDYTWEARSVLLPNASDLLRRYEAAVLKL